ncbi:HsdM family class I SAM-dependent methyltransferase [Nocardioides limicola]|uniref:HsdM family class I SAM-dependent methyltransferase n=1 Tax=Nocardioides limicola TaxID=2803368 RepID=UPI00193B8792|nr:N-6 DNA methylase [Nocardioides sp. DJM-14]
MSAQSIRDTLVRAGYEFVQLEPRIPDAKASWSPDVVAWAADAGGTLVPWAVVETKKQYAAVQPEAGLPALARARDLLGTVDHYVVVNDTEWFRADPGIQRLERVDGPIPPPNGGEGEITDVDLASSLISEDLWKTAFRARDRGAPVVDYVWADAQLTHGGLRTATGARLPITNEVLWQASRRSIVDFERRSKEAGIYTSPKVVAQAVAQLAGPRLTWDLLDPFCGAGSFLWEAIDYAQEHRTGLNTVLGYDINVRTAEVARAIGNAAPVPVEIVAADALSADLPLSTCVVSAPPFGLRVPEHHELLDGSSTRDGDLIVLDRILRLLGSGGRAVLHMPVGVTFRSTGEQYRRFLASRFRIAAILGLPSGAVAGTGIRSVLMVIDDAPSTDTFVAQLGEDWESQLAPGGAALEAALAHIDGPRP